MIVNEATRYAKEWEIPADAWNAFIPRMQKALNDAELKRANELLKDIECILECRRIERSQIDKVIKEFEMLHFNLLGSIGITEAENRS